jgi:lipopolysaccharide transport system ATP-binding protein
MPVKRYSTGMYVRLAFSVAAHLDPEILLLDEVFAVGDRAFQEKCIARISEMTRSGRTVVFVSHDVSSVARLCGRAIVLNEGRLVFEGPVDDAITRYLSSRPLGGGATADELREGSGEARIGHISISAADGGQSIRANQPLTIRVEFDAPPRVVGSGLRLHLGIDAPLGGQYVALSTDFSSARPLDGVELHESVAVCRIEELPLKPGSYTISAELEQPGGELVDRITKQALFSVLPTDFFGTGIFPGEKHIAPLLVRHSWEIERGGA